MFSAFDFPPGRWKKTGVADLPTYRACCSNELKQSKSLAVPMLLFGIVGVFLGSCAPTVSVHTRAAPGTIWSEYSSFAMLEPNRPVSSENTQIDPFTMQRLRQLTYLQLIAQGLQPATRHEAQLLVAVTAGEDEHVIVHRSAPYSNDIFYGSSISDNYVQRIDERTVAIDIISATNRSVLWRGTGIRRHDEKFGDVEYQEMIEAIVRECPLFVAQSRRL